MIVLNFNNCGKSFSLSLCAADAYKVVYPQLTRYTLMIKGCYITICCCQKCCTGKL